MKKVLLFTSSLLLLLALSPDMGHTTIGYARKTGKSCKYCHLKVGGGGRLTPEGRQFRDGGYKLPASPPSSIPLPLTAAAIGLAFLAGFGGLLIVKRRKKRP